ncbi:hypothetical protein [Aquicella lusitana]|uniref:Uncharacterized protein n=1 Tax=Aquicella lusitana TaxID=254246 RepID=A0A370GCJ2_9COXI|nr:hypothetical protein [Aquicella lusitana]RDI40174.1 hypothetical protein C8D86_1238 [Aquicella lusitana]VVC72435.1 hypothetical protein AQULUS_01470 [Aquicella lusitana]
MDQKSNDALINSLTAMIVGLIAIKLFFYQRLKLTRKSFHYREKDLKLGRDREDLLLLLG